METYLHEDVFISQPEGFVDSTNPTTHSCLQTTQKALYGLKQAPIAWFEKLKGALLSWGFQNSVADTISLFLHLQTNMIEWYFF